MSKASNNLNSSYSNLIRRICLADDLNRVAEGSRNGYFLLNELIFNIKKIFVKSRLGFMPPEPIFTRRGTFLKCAEF